MGVQGATVCPACNRQNALDRRFCQWCSQFLIKGDGIQRYAGFGRRLGAYVIDFLAPYGVFITVFAVAWSAAGSSGGAVAYLVILGWFVLQLVFWGRGTTFGKMLLGARVIRTDGSTAGFGTMFVREFIAKGLVATTVAVFTLGIGWLVWYLWALWDRDSQALHDKFMSTLVVYE